MFYSTRHANAFVQVIRPSHSFGATVFLPLLKKENRDDGFSLLGVKLCTIKFDLLSTDTIFTPGYRYMGCETFYGANFYHSVE